MGTAIERIKMPINLNTTSWEEDLDFAASTKETVEVPSNIIKKLLNFYRSAPENVQCGNCDDMVAVYYDD